MQRANLRHSGEATGAFGDDTGQNPKTPAKTRSDDEFVQL